RTAGAAFAQVETVRCVSGWRQRGVPGADVRRPDSDCAVGGYRLGNANAGCALPGAAVLETRQRGVADVRRVRGGTGDAVVGLMMGSEPPLSRISSLARHRTHIFVRGSLGTARGYFLNLMHSRTCCGQRCCSQMPPAPS